jgi:hypothetical protein
LSLSQNPKGNFAWSLACVYGKGFLGPGRRGGRQPEGLTSLLPGSLVTTGTPPRAGARKVALGIAKQSPTARGAQGIAAEIPQACRRQAEELERKARFFALAIFAVRESQGQKMRTLIPGKPLLTCIIKHIVNIVRQFVNMTICQFLDFL